ncbi:DUF4124 domain-containing protein [Thalassotalea sp. PP2-459]|uniref:DUF4124 domain-containing protein n=1 Tax=Thalassotalea sp. PP2-459 TaxID=1742724 RepID=UPI000945B415|nr:DUF4124 domain-containing protein [Thalassotalea sp. PP2-459]OKY25273.1 hypothetical protein BI291_16975 [Thalassotalea sp. PP2-459]
MKNIYLICALLFCISCLQAANAASTKVYVWVDESGKVVYSDTPRPGAEEVEVQEKNIISTHVDTSILDIKPKVIEDKFNVEITQPSNKQTIRDNTGSLLVQGRIKPLFKQGHTIQLLLDNKPHNFPQSYAQFRLSNIDRGEHQLKLSLLNEKGKVIASSKQITFYMHRASKISAN